MSMHTTSFPSEKQDLMLCDREILCQLFGELIRIMGQKAALWPQSLFRPLLVVTDLLPCAAELITHQYALVSFMDIFDYAVKTKWSHWNPGFLTSLFFSDWTIRGGGFTEINKVNPKSFLILAEVMRVHKILTALKSKRRVARLRNKDELIQVMTDKFFFVWGNS